MIAKTLLATIVAGLLAGILMTVAQQVRVVPLILHAEQFEDSGVEETSAVERDAHRVGTRDIATADGLLRDFGRLGAFIVQLRPAHAHGDAHPEEGGILFGMSRFSGTLSANLVTGVGFALVLMAVSVITATPLTYANGLVWGASGWLAVHLLPALGLPPELPGFPAAEIGSRQLWWILTVIVSGAGLFLLATRSELWAKAVGIVLLVLPHIFGAPQPDTLEAPVPAVLAAEYAVAALATTLFFWVVLGLLVGAALDRYGFMQEREAV